MHPHSHFPNVARLCEHLYKISTFSSTYAANWLSSPEAEKYFERDTEELDKLFTWSKTPQKYDFWKHIYEQLHNYTIQQAVETTLTNVPWWDRHYTLDTSNYERQLAQLKPISRNANDVTLWHEKQAERDCVRQRNLIALRRFIRSTICGQGG